MPSLEDIDSMLFGDSQNSDNDHSDASYRVTARELRQFIERAEKLDSEKKEISQTLRDLFAEAKGRGYDVQVMKKVIALRKRDPEDVAEEEAVLDMYREVLGL